VTRAAVHPGLVLGPQHKSMPPSAWDLTADAFLASSPRLAELQTPVLTVDDGAVDANTALMAGWAASHGVLLAPHGKTTMAPGLWSRFLAAGAWGVTLATPWQVQVARSAGVRRILLANELVDPVGIRWIAEELARDPWFELVCWADSVAAVQALDEVAAEVPSERSLPVLVELGVPGGRTGARDAATALAVADAIEGSRSLRLAGTGGYEGPAGHDRSAEAVAGVRRFLEELLRLHQTLLPRIDGAAPILTAGGSAFPDLVVEVLGAQASRSEVILRSGAYQVHDDGFYAAVSPFGRAGEHERLVSAMHAWSRVLSRPEPDLAILDAGRRDVPFDLGLPVAQRVLGSPDAADVLAGSEVTRLNDQHCFLRLAPTAPADSLPVGSVVRLGLSHPCTAFDKWRLVPVVDDAGARDPRVVDLLPTWF
jgi:D-serine deaminase-like pyridoxal phosphate-dependent protein